MAVRGLQLVEFSIKGEKDAVDQEQRKPKSLCWQCSSKIRAELLLMGYAETMSPVLK